MITGSLSGAPPADGFSQTMCSPVRALRSPMEPVGEAPMGAVPELGQHTAAVLAELGYADAEIDAMRTAGDILS